MRAPSSLFLPVPLILMASLATGVAVRGQGSLTPPGAPAPTQKSLQEIWEKVSAVETQNVALQDQVNELQAQNTQLRDDVAALVATSGQPTAFLAALFPDQLPWRITIVDALKDTGVECSLKFGPDGFPAIAYVSGSPDCDLYYAHFNGTTWDVGLLDATVNTTNSKVSLAFGPDGHPAIAYYDSVGADLHFARFNGSSWVFSVVDSASDVGRFASLAFGPDGQPAIAYQRRTSGTFAGDDLRFAQFDGDSWIPTTVDSASASTGHTTSLAFGPDGLPAIAYHDATAGDLRFARFDGAIWAAETVDSANDTGYDPSLAFGPDGQPAIGYFAVTAQELRLARRYRTTWVITDVSPLSAFGSLAFGPDGQPAMAMHRNYAGEDATLHFARLHVDAWTSVPVDGPYQLNGPTSLAFGPDGQPAIAYRDNVNGDLRFAQRYLPSP